ncbi:MAG: hydrogenase nickel incorporation protein HypB, partial [Okeania sp. SIO2D1]|nr:hydrogenase nickel incorporation protein HypB [Okeania sp. SIO2D1]
MCLTCGCSDHSETTLTNIQNDQAEEQYQHTHTLPDGTLITHTHSHSSPHEHHSPAAPHLHAQIHGTTITLEEQILGKNDLLAAQNRHWFQERQILALNLVSSPGSGKTTLLVRTINDLKGQVNFSVIEGDQATLNDAQRIRETGCQVVQINTGTGCHLEAAMIKTAYNDLKPSANSIVMIENVGNLVCPALFDLGESAKVVILSVTE